MGRFAVLSWIVGAIPVAAPAADVVINEIFYDPPDKTVPEEFLELYNSGTAPVDISGWFFSSGIAYEFPAGTVIEPDGFVVVAEDPETLALTRGYAAALGPYRGKLSSRGERVVLRTKAVEIVDEVTYRVGFPWPTGAAGEGGSMELINPSLDNDLGGSWRVSGLAVGGPAERHYYVAREDENWRYRKGTSEPSDPTSLWRQLDFVEDETWLTGQTSIGFGDSDDNTILEDMRDSYSSLYLRHRFTITEEEGIPRALKLGYFIDDGCIVWINGTEVARINVSDGDLPFDGESSRVGEADWDNFFLPDPTTYLQLGENVVAVHAVNRNIAGADFSVDIELFVPGKEDFQPLPPSPGRHNSVKSANAPPQVRQVSHSPQQPSSETPFLVTAKVTDPERVAEVELHYQVVEPGNYISSFVPVRRGRPPETNLAFEDPENWASVKMVDNGTDGDLQAGDDIYTVRLPAQAHRTLFRYRITATDSLEWSATVPHGDDHSLNFACFIYDGVPPWRGASRPGVTAIQEFSEEVMRSLPVYHLIATAADVTSSQYDQRFEGAHFFGTLVYEGIVYDHIRYENRGEFSTYESGKNKWRFHFNRGRDFHARDNYGRKYKEPWRTMNFNACSTPWVPTNRGMAGLGQSVAFKLYQLADTLGSNTHYIHFRVIDDADEETDNNQYRGDLWGLYITIEHPDGRFLDERSLPDGNTYKIESSLPDQKNQGPTQPTDGSDYIALRDAYGRTQPTEWWRGNVDLEGYYTFRAINRAINNMDLREGWNLMQYHNPETDRWTAIPWDLDMLYMPVTHWSGVMNFQNALRNDDLSLEYTNRARELEDLLFTPGQIEQLVDEHLHFVSPPGWPLTFADVDEAMWNYHPRTRGAHRGAFYRNPSQHNARGGTITRELVSADHQGMAQWVKDFMLQGYGANQLDRHAQDEAIPDTPTVTALGDPSFPIDDLVFGASAFTSSQGNDTFAAMKWRVAEVTPAEVMGVPRHYEIVAIWQSEELTRFEETIVVPADVVVVGATYRVRLRMKDQSGRWSHWSDPVEFTTGEPLHSVPAQEWLRITEIMYHPVGDSDSEFIELRNIGVDILDLRSVSLRAGIRFEFAESEVTTLEAGEHLVLVKDRRVFSKRYDSSDLLIGGEYDGSLSNGGEAIELVFGERSTILSFEYRDDWYPSTDGLGNSLVIRDAGADPDSWGIKESWLPSVAVHGSPGREDDDQTLSGLQLAGDTQQDGRLNVSDPIELMRHLFFGQPATLPCGDGTVTDASNRRLLDVNDDGVVDPSDGIYMLLYLFGQGPAPAQGTECIAIAGCPQACSP